MPLPTGGTVTYVWNDGSPDTVVGTDAATAGHYFPAPGTTYVVDTIVKDAAGVTVSVDRDLYVVPWPAWPDWPPPTGTTPPVIPWPPGMTPAPAKK